MKSIIGGDPPIGYPEDEIWVEDIAYDNDVILRSILDIDAAEADFPHLHHENSSTTEQNVEPQLDEYHDVQRQVMEALDQSDELHLEGTEYVDVPEDDDVFVDTMNGLEDLYRQATTPLYAGLKSSVVSATIIILNMCTVFKVSNRFIDELLRYLSNDLLPVNKKLPSTHYEVRKSIRKLGLNYRNIHACPDGCVLFEEE